MKLTKKGIRETLTTMAMGGALTFSLFNLSGIESKTTIMDNYYNSHPTKERVEFNQKFDMPLLGNYSLIEASEELPGIIEVMNREKKSKDFYFHALSVKDSLSEKKWAGTYCRNLDSGVDAIKLKNSVFNQKTLHHEIKHDKTWDVIDSIPDFLYQWSNISQEGNKKKVYVGEEWNKETLDNDSLTSLGFASLYSMHSPSEDIAELCSEAEFYPNYISEKYFSSDKIKKKLDLASSVGIVPLEFSDYMKMEKKHKNIRDIASYENYSFAVDSFLIENPSSIYESNLKLKKAELYTGNSNNLASINEAIRLHKDILTSDFKGVMEYPVALEKLSDLYLLKSEESEKLGLSDEVKLSSLEKSVVYEKAGDEYDRRESASYLNLSKTGVNDYLIKKGIDLK